MTEFPSKAPDNTSISRRGSRWEGSELDSTEIGPAIQVYSGKINDAWDQEIIQNDGQELGLESYQRISQACGPFSVKITDYARDLVRLSGNRLGNLILSQHFLFTTFSALKSLQRNNPDQNLDPVEVIEYGIEVGMETAYDWNKKNSAPVTQVVYSKIMNHFKRAKEDEGEAVPMGYTISELAGPSEDFADSFINKLDAQTLYGALRKLPTKNRSVLGLIYGIKTIDSRRSRIRSRRAIAEKFGVSEQAVDYIHDKSLKDLGKEEGLLEAANLDPSQFDQKFPRHPLINTAVRNLISGDIEFARDCLDEVYLDSFEDFSFSDLARLKSLVGNLTIRTGTKAWVDDLREYLFLRKSLDSLFQQRKARTLT